MNDTASSPASRFATKILDRRYRVDALVGEGGFATVHAGLHLALGTPIAIKIFKLPREASTEKRAELVARFMEEARVLTRLRHDGIVRTFDQGLIEEDGESVPTPYLVMEWCGEESLKAFLARTGGGLDVATAYGLIDAIAAAIAHAHELGVAHRDLKPSNVMLARSAGGALHPRVIDFGIAKLFEETAAAGSGDTATRSDFTPYTPAYAAPEQIARGRTGPWTDVHAIALLFVELVTGRAPYGGGDDAGLAAIDPERPTPGRRGVDVGRLEPVIARALALRPADRQRSATELLAELRAAAGEMRLPAQSPVRDDVAADAADADADATGDATREPLSRTVPSSRRVETAPAEETGSVLTPRRAFVAAAGLGALTAGAFGLRAWLGHTRPASRGASNGVSAATSGAPASSLAPSATAPATVTAPPAIRASSITLKELERRVTAAGLTVANSVTISADPVQLMVYYEGSGAAYLNECRAATSGLPPELRPLATLLVVRRWIEGDQAEGFQLAYAIDDNWVLSSTGIDADATLRAFDKLCDGIHIDARGNSFPGRGPDPARNAADSRVVWVAKNLAGLTNVELVFRIEAAGAKAVENKTATARTFEISEDHDSGEIVIFEGTADDGGERAMADLRRRGVPFCRASDETATILCRGSGRLLRPAFLASVLAGMKLDVVREPPA